MFFFNRVIYLIILFSFIVTIVLGLALILGVLAFRLKVKRGTIAEKLSPFECGFSPQEPARTLFSIHFFLVAIIFLIFDVELVLLFPNMAKFPSLLPTLALFILLLLLLFLGLAYEWSAKILDWANF